MPTKWTEADIPDLAGQLAVVTGANGGLGAITCKALAAHGAQVIMACRNQEKGRIARDQILEEFPEAQLELMALDLADLASVRSFAAAVQERDQPIDLLINNAGVMALPYRQTSDGFEMQLGTNHLGHFALTGLLLDSLRAAPAPRVVTVSSLAHRMGKMRFHDLQSETRYEKWSAYGQSKLANLLFMYELQRRLDAGGEKILSLAAHPGYSDTDLQSAGPRMAGASWTQGLFTAANKMMAQSAAMGALPTLFAATDPDAAGGDFIGPGGLFEVWGHPKVVQPMAKAKNEDHAAQLWAVSETLTGVSYLS